MVGWEPTCSPLLISSGDILTALRKSLPAHVAVSAKIRLLPDQDDTIALVKRIVNTGVSCLTVHCRTKEMRPRERALVHRLKELVETVESTGLGVPVIENGDCISREDALRLKELTGTSFSLFVAGAFWQLPMSGGGAGPWLYAREEGPLTPTTSWTCR